MERQQEQGVAAVREAYTNLCAELNMDSGTGDEAWRSYCATLQHYSLEGEQLHWLACALYVACRRGSLPTVGQQETMQGNGVSLTRLLRSTKLSLIQFFNKARLWADMCNLKTELVSKIDKLERNFAVSNVIFKKYGPIFVDLFRDPADDPPRVQRSRKQKRPPCSPGEVFDFCWTLFIRVKGHFPAISDDLVNSYHLLLSCVDYVHSQAWVEDRTDLLNPVFDCGAPVGQEGVCILERLCTMHDGILTEVKSIREHWLKPYIKNISEKAVLQGASLLDQANFDTNCRNLRKDYETYVLSIGEYDERVFLGEEAPAELGTPSDLPSQDLGERISVKRRNMQTTFDGPDRGVLVPGTPLSGRHYLKAREQAVVTPVSSATYLVERLNKMVAGRRPEPSPALARLLSSCSDSALEEVKQRVTTMGELFTARYNTHLETKPETKQASFAGMRLVKGQVLYYRVLETLLLEEQRRGKNVGQLVGQSHFHQSLFAACLEVVIFSHYSQKTFPWILDTFHLEPFNFFKVIEVVIRAEEGLVRDVVKHLQQVEEQILESLAWVSSSPVWIALQHGAPSCEEVSLPTEGPASHLQSPVSHLRTPGAFTLRSPIAADRFKSPGLNAVARRQLFSGGGQPGQSVLAQGHGEALKSPPKQRPKQTGMDLFFRKVYHLAHFRLDDLCCSLQVRFTCHASSPYLTSPLQLDIETKRRIWTCLEWTLVTHPDVLKDRHLDQVIMCVLYVVCKVSQRVSRPFIAVSGFWKSLREELHGHHEALPDAAPGHQPHLPLCPALLQD